MIPDGSLLFIGTATVLLRCQGFTVLTDPNFLHRGDVVPLGYGLRSRRLTEPALSIEELPPLDVVVLSHHHGDHFDRIATARLRKDVPIVTTMHAARKLSRGGFTAPIPLRTWQGSESLLEFRRPGRPTYRIYLSGDTLMHSDLEQIPERFPDIDLAVLHLGGTRVLGVTVTMDGPAGVRALRIVRPREAVPVHYDDYTVFKDPLSAFQTAVGAAGLPTRVHYLKRGDIYGFGLAGQPGHLLETRSSAGEPPSSRI